MNEHEYPPRLVATLEAPATPEYRRYSTMQLGLALWDNLIRTMSADLGHSMIEGWILGLQLVNWILNGDERDQEIDWTPDATGVNPTFDRWAARGRHNISAIREELSYRRSRRTAG